ncbi:MAG TPA: DUF6798 domain-containing protein [Pirellulaceae bacterium]|jgi:hypothetical protein
MGRAKDNGEKPQQVDLAGWKPAPQAAAAFEIAWIFLIFFLFAGSLPPDVGESHYLVKAKHYWQPGWCAGDLFVESRDAHLVFNWTFGWMTRVCSLATTAWIGRMITWLLLAWSWRRLSWAIVPRPLVSLLSAGLMLLFLKHFHLAGEWVIGGVEAKGFAYVLVFLALEAIARNRWQRALAFSGAAGAFHVLVGGWTVVAIGLAWLFSGRERPTLQAIAPAAALGLLLSLPGLVPALALNWAVPKEVTQEAARIYAFERLSHHLIYSQFDASNVFRFQILVLGWAAAAWMMRRDLFTTRLQRVVAGAIVIAVVGIIIDQALVVRANLTEQSPLDYETTAAGLLRYYWFRMSDSLVPVGLSLAIVAGVIKLETKRPEAAALLKVALILLAAGNLAEAYYSRKLQPVPRAVLQPQPTADSEERPWWRAPPKLATSETSIQDWFRDWQRVCQWVAAETPADALFLTPQEQQTFKWYAGRPEVVTWKDVPQDARGLLEWKKRLDEVYPRDPEHRQHDLAAFDDAALVNLAQKYGAKYVLIDRTRADRPIRLLKMYPLLVDENPSFAVYRVPEAAR